MNGNSKLAYWLVGLVAPAVIGGAGAWITSTTNLVHRHAERLAVLESQIGDTRDELKRINRKLDQLLEFRRNDHGDR